MTKHYYALAQYKGRLPFIIGSVLADSDEHARLKMSKAIPDYLPDGWEILSVHAGAVTVVDGDFPETPERITP